MKRKKIFTIVALSFALFLSLFALSACREEEKEIYTVYVEESCYFSVEGGNVHQVERGETLSLTLTFEEGYSYDSNDKGYSFERDTLFVNDVRSNKYIVVSAKANEEFAEIVTFHSNGGKIVNGKGDTYGQGFTPQGDLYPHAIGANFYNVFQRNGYLPLEYNTMPDGSGQAFSLGSKILLDGKKNLYVIWQKESDNANFKYEKVKYKNKEGWKLTKYTGNESCVAIPETIEGLPVFELSARCFNNVEGMETLVLNRNILYVQSEAVYYCRKLTTVYLPDTVNTIYDDTFIGCDEFANLRMLALRAPVYSSELVSLTALRVESMYANRNAEKPSLFFYGGSGIFHSLDGELLEEGLNGEYTVFNLGQNANLSAPLMLDIYMDFMREGDTLVFTPEFSALQFSREWHNIDWVALESFYDAFRYVDIREYTGVFTAYYSYMYGENLFSFVPKLVALSTDYSDTAKHKNEYFTRNYETVYDPKLEVEVSTLSLDDYKQKAYGLNVVFDDLANRGVTVLYSHATVYEYAFTNDLSELEDYAKFIKENLHCTLISECYADCLVPKEWLYDSAVHLNTAGAKENTKRILNELKAYGL